MATQSPKKAERGSSLMKMKLDIHLLGRKKKKTLEPAERKAAEFLSTQQGKIIKAVDCGRDSGIKVVVDKDEAVLQVELLGNKDDNRKDFKEPDIPPGKLNLTKLYKDCFTAKRSYELALDAFIAHDNKRWGIAAAANASHMTSTHASAPKSNGAPRETTFEQLEEDIKQTEQNIEAAINSLMDVKGKRKARHDEQWQVVRGLRTAFHKFAENARNVKSYVALVPKSAGFGAGGLICGGIEIVLKAAERYVVMDKHMERALRGIKEAMVHKAYVFDKHEPDRRMHRLISELFALIFVVLESLLKWVHQQGTGMALLGAMLQPETYGQELAKLIADMERRSGALEKYGHDLELSEMKKKLDALKGMMENTQGAIQTVLKKQDRELKIMKNNNTQVGDVGKAVEQGNNTMLNKVEELRREMKQMRRLSSANVVQNIFVLISQDPPHATGRLLPASHLLHSATQQKRKLAVATEAVLDAAAVLVKVGFNEDLVPRDSWNILQAARLSTPGAQLVTEMTNHVRLQALVEVPSSAILFIEGGPDSRHEARGPISVATAHIIAALARGRKTNQSLYALAYFCSEHCGSRRDSGTALALIITLLLQLIDQHRDFDAALLGACCEAVLEAPSEASENDVLAYCNLLQQCVLALPEEATLFCVVEGIAFYEGPRKRTEHTRLILERLLELGKEEEEGRARVKCLFTTPARSPKFIDLFEPYDVLTVQAVNSSGFFRRNSWVIGRVR